MSDAPDELGSGASIFVPPYSLITQQVATGSGSGEDEVTIPRRLLDFLLRCLLDHTDFDEEQYRTCNPDVVAAIREKAFANGREHYLRTGYFEGRAGGTKVLETWYLARNPDVAAAKQAGKIASGELQYRLAGALEWREPNPESVNWIQAWKAALA